MLALEIFILIAGSLAFIFLLLIVVVVIKEYVKSGKEDSKAKEVRHVRL